MKPEWSRLHAKLVTLETVARHCYRQIAEFDCIADGGKLDALHRSLKEVRTALDLVQASEEERT